MKASSFTLLRHRKRQGGDLIADADKLGDQLSMQALQDAPRSTNHLNQARGLKTVLLQHSHHLQGLPLGMLLVLLWISGSIFTRKIEIKHMAGDVGTN